MLAREAVELFHLSFLGALGTGLDKRLYAVKGGVNLRFFLGSPRSSEDLDLDVQIVEPTTLRRKVERLIVGKPLARRLAAKGVTVVGFSAPKQTTTTQRWKVSLRTPPPGATASTKIEASRRGLDEGVELGSVDPALVAAYGVAPVIASHYGRETAFWQKVRALAGRSTPQARDVFDLDFLLRAGTVADQPPAAVRPLLGAAADAAVGVSFDDFAGQVLPYLPEEHAVLFDRATWNAAVARVVSALERLE